MNPIYLLIGTSLAIPSLGFGGENTDPPDKARIAVVGDADRLNISQAGYCGKRVDIDHPTDMSFLVPADRKTWFYIQSKFHTPLGTYSCSGDFSFMPASGKLTIIRYTFPGSSCLLEIFQSLPGQTPVRIKAEREPPRICLLE